MKAVLAIIVSLIITGTVWASPDLDRFTDIQGKRIYRDQVKTNFFYLSPSPPVLAQGPDGLPGVSFDIFRYHGRSGTGDSGKFRVKGVLSLEIQRDHAKKVVKQIKSHLKKTYKVRYPKLRSMPVADTHGKLIFGDRTLSWSQSSRWSGKRISLSLDEVMSQVLWEALEAGQTLISVEMAEALAGVRKTENGQWEPAVTTFSSTLPVTLDMAAHPTLFRKTELGGRMVRGYTGIDIFCFDFLEQLDETLYSKIVEVAIPTTGAPLKESVTFRQDSDCRRRIEFKLAKDLDTPYKVRITRIFIDGRTEQGDWVKRKGEAMLDITDYKKTIDEEQP